MAEIYKIIKVMNNNVVLVCNLAQEQECVLIGKGIGFGKGVGQQVEIPGEKIEKQFVAFDKMVKEQYFELIAAMDPKIAGLCAEVIAMSEAHLGELSPKVHVVLTDHIGFALERIKQGMEIHNPFLYEIQMLYPEEYRVASQGVQYLSEHIGIAIPEDEIGFVTLHFHSARQNVAVNETVKQTRLLKELLNLIEHEMQLTFSPSELTYQRLVNHLRGLIDRVRKGITVENPLFESIRQEFTEAFELALKLKIHMEKTYDLSVPDNELGYMALHIERIRKVKIDTK